ncbi:PQQ-dependent sugar dehydrogenase [Halobacteria archaeon HArc-gm2]|nr:PQQ-dependent sugar dehydrogenase [Halobacteria archaeon HArc-gm2]
MSPDDTLDEDDRRQAEPDARTSRRWFLAATGLTGLAGVGGFAFAQQSSNTYEFGGEVAGWQARSPAAIEGETNPTLDLAAGTEYEVVWENLDGAPHNFVIQDADGDRIVGTEIVDEQGATLSLTFTATEEMAQYICTIHPSSMVGDIQITGGESATGTGGTATPQADRFVPEGPTVGVQRVADGPLTSPVAIRSVPGMDGAHVVVDQPGQLYFLADGELQPDPLLDVGPTLAFGREGGFDERGLLGLAFHPEFEENGRLFLRYSSVDPYSDDGLVGPGDREFPDDWDHVEVLSEFRAVGTGSQLGVDANSERVLLEVPSPQFNHNGGAVTFGPDGYLYTTVGDGGNANDVGLGHVADWYDGNEGGNAQNVRANLLGKVLRVDVDAGASAGDDEPPGSGLPYGVPDDNPFVGTGGMDEIYAYGLHNPWRMSFDGGTLIAADVGQDLYEEVDVIEAGGNYGWNVREGFHCFDAANPTEPPAECPSSAPDAPPHDGRPLRDPVLEYPHTYDGTSVGISITGGYVYRGDELSELSGRYVFGDWSTSFAEPRGRIFVATPDGGGSGTETRAATATSAATGTETGAGSPSATATASPAGEGGEATPGSGGDDQLLPSDQPWPFEEVLIEGGEGQQLNRFINAFGQDSDGNLYVLASRTGRITGDGGEVYRLVPAGDGDQISQPEMETPMPGADDGGEGAGESAGNETTNESAGTEAGNETTATETISTDQTRTTEGI